MKSLSGRIENSRKESDMTGTIVVATGNADKLIEIRQILSDPGLEIISMKDAGVDVEIIENGTTFEENAVIKARTVAMASGRMALADDSGLVVDALGGEPGIHSARYMGRDTSYDTKNHAIIELVNEYCRKKGQDNPAENPDRPGSLPDGTPGELRSARFVCAVAAAWPDGTVKTAVGTMEGRIGYEIAGENGFGYDPIFFLPEYGMTSAQISPQQKNAISHRGKAFRLMRDLLQ